MTLALRIPLSSCGAAVQAALLLAVLCTGLAAPRPAHAQDARAAGVLEGRVLRQGEPVGGVEVTLHRVTADSAGVVRATRSDEAGRFALPLPAEQGSGFAVYFATADYRDVRYFGPVLHADEPLSGYPLAVYDTTTAAAVADSVRVTRRDVVLVPQETGGWEVNEVVGVRNPSSRTLLPRRGVEGWGLQIPDAALDFEAADVGAAPVELQRVGEQVVLLSALPPGERRLFFRYRLPADARGTELLPVAPTDTLSIFVQQPSPEVEVAGREPTRLVPVEQQRLLQWEIVRPAPDQPVRITWDRAVPASPALVAGLATLLVLAVGGWAALRHDRRGRGPASASA